MVWWPPNPNATRIQPTMSEISTTVLEFTRSIQPGDSFVHPTSHASERLLERTPQQALFDAIFVANPVDEQRGRADDSALQGGDGELANTFGKRSFDQRFATSFGVEAYGFRR